MTETVPAAVLADIDIAPASSSRGDRLAEALRTAFLQIANDPASAHIYAQAFQEAADVSGNARFRAAGRALLSPGRPRCDDEAALLEVNRLVASGKSAWSACLEVGQSQSAASRLARKRRSQFGHNYKIQMSR